jgi:hypothetical protein
MQKEQEGKCRRSRRENAAVQQRSQCGSRFLSVGFWGREGAVAHCQDAFYCSKQSIGSAS